MVLKPETLRLVPNLQIHRGIQWILLFIYI